MTEDRRTRLFFELFAGLPRQGPGDDASTIAALAYVPGLTSETRVLDLGCGTGTQTLVLARHSPARILAIDNHPPFVDELNRRARALGFGDRLEARVADMRRLDLPPASAHAIVCEGAIYVVGFEEGLREWRHLLVPGGHLAVTEVCWTRAHPPEECAAFWAAEYPAIRSIPALLDAIATSGYEAVAHFQLPASAWWDNYYRPLQENIAAFRGRYAGDAEAHDLADQVQREIDIWRKYSEYYAYCYFVLRAR